MSRVVLLLLLLGVVCSLTGVVVSPSTTTTLDQCRTDHFLITQLHTLRQQLSYIIQQQQQQQQHQHQQQQLQLDTIIQQLNIITEQQQQQQPHQLQQQQQKTSVNVAQLSKVGAPADKLVANASNTGYCPPGFTYVLSVNGCYRIVTEDIPWSDVDFSCGILADRAQAVVIDSKTKQAAIQKLIASDKRVSSCYYALWTAGQRATPGSSTWQWKTSTYTRGFNYTNWDAGEPNNYQNNENCLAIYNTSSNPWNDLPCSAMRCYICEIDVST